MIGEGKYSRLAEAVRVATRAEGVVLVVINGSKGSGFSCNTTPSCLAALPEIFDSVAQQIRTDLAMQGGPQ